MDEPNPRGLLKFRAEPALRRAIKLRAAYEDVDLQDVIVAILTAGLAEEIAEIRRRGVGDGPISRDESKNKGIRSKGENA